MVRYFCGQPGVLCGEFNPRATQCRSPDEYHLRMGSAASVPAPGTTDSPVAFVLSGGANRGAAQAGMLEALLDAGIVPDLLVGTSIGAVNAAFMAAGPTPDRARALSEIWRRLSAEDIFPLGAAQVTRAILAGGLFSPAPLRRMLEREIPFRLIEEAVTPLRIVATRCERRADASRSLRFLAAGLDRRAGQARAQLRLAVARLDRTV